MKRSLAGSWSDDPAMLDARGLVKHFDGRRVVDGVSFRCVAGQVVGLLGANGAGKTTTLRMCYGFLQADEGVVRVGGHDLARRPDEAKALIGVCTQEDTFDEDFSVRDNLLQFARYFRPRLTALDERVDALLARFGLDAYARQKPDALSGGFRRRLMIARALVHAPRLLFLDEPTTGLDPQARVRLWELVDTLRSDGLAIVLTTHYMDEAERLSDRLIVLERGSVCAEGAPRDVLGDVVGEHVVVLEPGAMEVDRIERWLAAQRRPPPARVLGTIHVALDGPGLAAFSAAFGAVRFEVRKPTLDDLFLKLAQESPQESP